MVIKKKQHYLCDSVDTKEPERVVVMLHSFHYLRKNPLSEVDQDSQVSVHFILIMHESVQAHCYVGYTLVGSSLSNIHSKKYRHKQNVSA